MRDGINTLSAWCSKGVRVVSVTQQIDLSGTVGHLIASVLSLYELYVKRRIEVGLGAADESRTVAHEEAKRQLLGDDA